MMNTDDTRHMTDDGQRHSYGKSFTSYIHASSVTNSLFGLTQADLTTYNAYSKYVDS